VLEEMLQVKSKEQVLEKIARMMNAQKTQRKDYFSHFLDVSQTPNSSLLKAREGQT